MILDMLNLCFQAVSSQLLTTCAKMQICVPLAHSADSGHGITNIPDISSITLQGDEFFRIHDGHIARCLTYIIRFGGVSSELQNWSYQQTPRFEVRLINRRFRGTDDFYILAPRPRFFRN